MQHHTIREYNLQLLKPINNAFISSLTSRR